MIQDIAELLSLALTIPTIILGAWVVRLWARESVALFRGRSRRAWNATEWFILGVAIGFFGSVADNAYWGIAWTASYLEHPGRAFWFERGVYSNIPFRQIAGLAAAYCHIRSAVTYRGRGEKAEVNRATLATLCAGAIFAAALVFIR